VDRGGGRAPLAEAAGGDAAVAHAGALLAIAVPLAVGWHTRRAALGAVALTPARLRGCRSWPGSALALPRGSRASSC
jgi:hypothetical protein